MGDLMNGIMGRRSIRKYQEREVPDELLNPILESIRWAPSWANTQCWEVVVVKDPAKKEQLQQTLANNPAKKAMVQAPIVLGICGKLRTSGYYNNQATSKFGDWFMFDLGIATQNLCLTAHVLGLGTVIVGLFDHNKARDILEVPDGYELVAMIPLGYPAKDPETPRRREVNEFIHYEGF